MSYWGFPNNNGGQTRQTKRHTDGWKEIGKCSDKTRGHKRNLFFLLLLFFSSPPPIVYLFAVFIYIFIYLFID